jgi:hypothetical protein
VNFRDCVGSGEAYIRGMHCADAAAEIRGL